ncbi:MAG: phosphotransferase [Catenulispora sp.]|nr:phosphotransferase [Catenulispora sp.]
MRGSHTDPHLGNVLAAPGRIWLIDWDDAALSAPEHDLMLVLGGAYGDEYIGDRERAWFFEGYGDVDFDAECLAYCRASRGLVDVAFLAEEAFTAPDPGLPADSDRGWRTRAAQMLAHQFGPTGFISLALAG